MIEKLVESIREPMLPFFAEGEESSSYAASGNYYEWYFSYARRFRPRQSARLSRVVGANLKCRG